MEYSIAADPAALVRARAQVGAADITVCTDGTCRFDGGAMFGVVPRTLWERKMAPDDRNCVELGLNCVVVRIGGKVVLIETGFGNKLSPKQKQIYRTEELLPISLKAAGVGTDEVDYVINTHLHWDHCGWNTVVTDGRPTPFFANAQYVMHAGEVAHGRLQTERDRVSYVPNNYEPLLAEGRVRLLQEVEPGHRTEVCPGISVECFPGHTAHMMVVWIESHGECACFASDLLPTSAHLSPTWVMAFDLSPMRTIQEKHRFLGTARQRRVLVLFPHDQHVPLGELAWTETGECRLTSDAPRG